MGYSKAIIDFSGAVFNIKIVENKNKKINK